MRVLHINSYYNGCPFYRHLYDAQIAHGLEPRVYIPMPRGNGGARADYGPYADVSENHGRYDRAVFHLKHQKILRDAMARYGGAQFDMVHAHSLFSNGYVAMNLAGRIGRPYIVAVRDTDINTFFAKMPHLRGLGRRILSGASKVVFLSGAYRDEALSPYLSASGFAAVRAKSVVIPNGIDPFWHEHPGQPHTAPAGSALRLISVGRASGRKNILTAVRAAEILAERGHQVQFDVVIGQVEDEGILARIGASPLVSLHRNLSQDQLLPLYRGADMFVLPSLTETFGLVYAEAMSQGLPVLYTRGQGFDGQFADGEAGYAVEPMDPFDIADAAQRVLGNYEAISANCTRLARRFDWTEYARQYAAIYREVAKERHDQ